MEEQKELKYNESKNKSGFKKNHESYWISSTIRRNYPPLNQNISADAVIAGGGMAGLTTAVLLKEAGLNVVLLDGEKILGGTTGYTTAKVTSQHRLIYDYLINKFGVEKARQYAEANQAAVELIAQRIENGKLDCDFSRQPAYVFTESNNFTGNIEKEVQASQSLGLPSSYVTETGLPFRVKCAMRFENQATFHPLKYMLALIEPFINKGLKIYENTRAIDIIGKSPYTVVTDKGNVTASTVVIATHYPFYDKPGMYYARMYQSRSYISAFKINGNTPEGMYISADDPVHSFRTASSKDGNLLLAAGEGHRTGQIENTKYNYERLIDYTNRIYDIQSVEYQWSAQDCITIDSVPYIGQLSPGKKGIYVATGFGKWGMTNATAAAIIISDMITGKDNLWAPVFEPSRFNMAASAKELVKHGTQVVKSFASDKVNKTVSAGSSDTKTKPGHTCTHMGCRLAWNEAEQTWDCPCHGSRFTKEGKVVESPAVRNIPD